MRLENIEHSAQLATIWTVAIVPRQLSQRNNQPKLTFNYVGIHCIHSPELRETALDQDRDQDQAPAPDQDQDQDQDQDRATVATAAFIRPPLTKNETKTNNQTENKTTNSQPSKTNTHNQTEPKKQTRPRSMLFLEP